MPNVTKYANADWPEGSPISGERMATAGEYTGQHKGTVMQDAIPGADNAPYLRAREAVRYGTLTPDAADSNFPDRLVQVSYTASGAVTEISLTGASYNQESHVFEDVPSKTASFTFKDAGATKTATNNSGKWSVA